VSHDASVQAPPPGQPQQPFYAHPPKKGMATAALVLGILAILGCLIPIINVFSLILALIGLVLGFLAFRKVKKDPVQFAGKGQAIAGIVLSVLAILGFIISNAILGAAVNSASEDPEVAAAVEELQESTAPEASAPVEEPAAPPAETEAPPAEEEPSEPAGAGVGEAVAVGDFEYNVSGIECGVESIGPDGFGEEPQGQFCIVSLSVTNVGDSAETFFTDNVVLLNDAGQEYSADDVASLYIEGNDTFLTEVNPGNTLEGSVAFDIPADATPAQVQLSGGLFSSDTTTVTL
jgi:hypothetical protein